jgi:arylsulfatase A-like enzyme
MALRFLLQPSRRRSGYGLALVLAGLLSGVALAAAEPEPRRPDIAILLTDQQSGDALGCAGTPGLRTPAIDALAKEGVRFTHAFCATPQCSPSRAALVTGRYPHRAGVIGNVQDRAGVPPAGMSGPLDPKLPNLGSLFRTAGYQTAYFGKWHLGGEPSDYGFEVSATPPGDEVVTERVLEFLKARTDRRPLFLIVSWLNPHEIYQARQAATEGKRAGVRLPASLNDDLSTKPFPQRQYLREDQGKAYVGYTAEQWRRYREFYYELIEHVDAQIGSVVKSLRAGSPQSLVLFSSDHGDLQGAHGLPYKGPAMYEELVRVPLIISWPGHVKPKTQSALVSNIDVLPTLCSAAGVKTPDGVDGHSLRDLLESTGSPAPVRDIVIGEYYGKQGWRVPSRMLRTPDWKYVRTLQYGEELYDLRADPAEVNNLVHDPKHAARRRELAERLDHWIKETGDPFPTWTVTDRKGQVLSPEATRAQK